MSEFTRLPDFKFLSETLKNLAFSIKDILDESQKSFKDSVDDFMSENVSKLGKSIGVISNALISLQVSSWEALEEVCKRNFCHLEVQEAFENVQEVQEDWDSFLDDVDSKLKCNAPTSEITQGDKIPQDISLISTKDLRQLQDRQMELAELGANVIVVSFGSAIGARLWIASTKCEFPLYLDENRQLYKTFGLGRSIKKVWNMETLTYYAEQKACGRSLPKKFENVEDDPHQMGGDFVVDSEGILRLKYCSKVANDRPSVERLLTVAKECQEGKYDGPSVAKKLKTV